MRLLLLLTGGTLVMRPGPASVPVPPSGRGDGTPASERPAAKRDAQGPLAPDVHTRDLVRELPVLSRVADIETRVLFALASSDVQPHHWVELAREVHGALARDGADRFDGVVVVHGTDTMAYTASALAFLLPGLDRPVVLTGSQTPLSAARGDARANLVDACYLAALPIPEVAVAFDSVLLRGCRSTKLDAWGMTAFGSPSCPPLAELGVDVRIGAHALGPRPARPFDPRIETRVLAVRIFPGLDPKLLSGALSSGVKGMVIEAFGAGNLPHLENSLIPVVEAARDLDVPVVIVSQSPRGRVELGRYAGGAAAAAAGAIGAGDMTPEAALAKLMVTLGRAPGDRVDAARAAFAAAEVGEMS